MPDYELVFDNSITQNPEDLKNNCHVGMSFKEGQVGMISQVKYFMKDLNLNKFRNMTIF